MEINNNNLFSRERYFRAKREFFDVDFLISAALLQNLNTFLGCHVKLFKQLLYVVPVVVISPYRPYQAKRFQAVHGASAAALSRLAWRFSRSMSDSIKHGYGTLMYYIHDITHYLVHNMTCTYIYIYYLYIYRNTFSQWFVYVLFAELWFVWLTGVCQNATWDLGCSSIGRSRQGVFHQCSVTGSHHVPQEWK